MFSAERLQQELSNTFSTRGYIFQIVHQAPVAEIYLNYPETAQVSQEQVTQEIEAAIATYEWGEIEQVYLVGRRLGDTDPEWDVALALASSPVSISETVIEENRSQEPNDASCPADIASHDLAADDEPESDAASNATFPDLTEYCFTRNQQLLKSDILPPPEEIAQLIVQFNEFSLPVKHHLLTQLKEFFTGKAKLNAQCEDEQIWITALEDLSGTYRRKTSIWLSRYCLNPEQTLATVEDVLNPPVVVPEKTRSQPPTHSTDSLTDAVDPSSSAPQTPPYVSPPASNSAPQEPVAQATHRQKINWWVPAIAFLITLLLVGMDVRGRYSPRQYAQICKDSAATAEICQVSGQLIGIDDFKTFAAEGANLDSQSDQILDDAKLSSQEKAEAFLDSPEYEISQMSLGLCMGQAHINAGYILKDMMEGEFMMDEANASIERVLPGVFNYQVSMPHKETQQAVSTSCTLAGPPHGMAYLGGDRLPDGWPQTPYKPQKNAIGFFLSGIKLSALSSICMYTCFSGVGMLVAIICGMAIRVDSLKALYEAAVVLGLVQYVLSLLPSFGIFGIFFQPAILSMILGLASIPIKDLHINWSAGYRLVGSTLLVISLIRKFLGVLLVYTLFTLVA